MIFGVFLMGFDGLMVFSPKEIILSVQFGMWSEDGGSNKNNHQREKITL